MGLMAMTDSKKTLTRSSRAKELSVYIGQYVAISVYGSHITVHTEEEQINQILQIVGYVIDVTDNFVHLGQTKEGFDKSVAIENILVIEVVSETIEPDDMNIEIQ
jgi:hypothetical protein